MAIKLQPQNQNLNDLIILRDTILGRSHEPGCILIDDPEISRQHAKLYQKITPYKVIWFIQDMGSVNGTYVNGIRINAPTILSNKDEIHLGQRTFLVTIDETFIWQGEGEYAPNFERPHSIPPFINTLPQPAQTNSQNRRQHLKWELLGLVGLLGVGWWRAGDSKMALLWFMIALVLLIITVLLAFTLENSLFCLVGWFLLVLLTGTSLWVLANHNQ